MELRKDIIMETHERLKHRGIDAINYDMKGKWYWPGMRKTIINVVKACEVCQINNKKKMGGSEFVQTSRVLEKVALDLIDTGKEYVLVAMDYFSRVVLGEIIRSKEANEIVKLVRKWCKNGDIPEELITDNGKEFSNKEVGMMCNELGIKHTKVSVESHRSNGRVERMIETIREGLAKDKRETWRRG